MNEEIPSYVSPVPDEISAVNLTVTGSLPSELTGRYFRNGPNPKPGDPAGHWFMGAGMLHGVRLREGKAEWYRNRWVGGPHQNNTSVIEHAGRVFALVEAALPVEVDRELNTLGSHDFDGLLATAMTAHPKEDPDTGELHFFGYSALPPFLTYHRVSADGKLVSSQEVEVGGPTMMHDFAITENYVVWLDLPVVFDHELVGKTMPYRWSDAYPARVGVMAKTGGAVRWYDVEPCYVFHVGNAREDSAGRIVLNAVRYGRTAWLRMWTGIGGEEDLVDRAAASGTSQLYRWTLDPASGRVHEQPHDDRAVEFPTLNDLRIGRDNRFLYAVGHDSVIKYDLADGSAQADSLGEGWHLGEAVFTPAEQASNEDDGWLISIATHDDAAVPSRLLVHDATNVAAGPVATVHLPRRVPAGFHGKWFADSGFEREN